LLSFRLLAMIRAMDSQILKRLQANARETWAALGSALGVTGPAIAERVKKLEDRGVIRGYRAVIDPTSVGYTLLAFVAVTVERPDLRGAFLEKVMALPEVLECHHVAGDYDYLLKIRCRDTTDLERVISDELKSFEGIVRTRTTIAMKTMKETSELPIA
jgi:Lrp/AsnC family transcriptional regulator, leucine-responsive regulatory protein